MENKDFFSFKSKLVLSNGQAVPINLKTNEKGVSDHSKLIKGQYDGIDFPVIFKQKGKIKLNDILDTGWVSLFLISDNLRMVLEENRLTGWQIFPIRLYDVRGKEINGYHGFSIIGHSGPTSYDKSSIIENEAFYPYYKGVSVDKWDGSDFFTPDKTYQIFITNRAAEILKKKKITNIQLENLAEKETPIRHVRRENNA